MHPRPTWWFVITRPVFETNEPEPPSLKRTEERRTWSSHSCVGVKPYLSFRTFVGGLSKVHIPSSAASGAATSRASAAVRAARKRRRICSPPGNHFGARRAHYPVNVDTRRL